MAKQKKRAAPLGSNPKTTVGILLGGAGVVEDPQPDQAALDREGTPFGKQTHRPAYDSAFSERKPVSGARPSGAPGKAAEQSPEIAS
jgi:hypothetical protein